MKRGEFHQWGERADAIFYAFVFCSIDLTLETNKAKGIDSAASGLNKGACVRVAAVDCGW